MKDYNNLFQPVKIGNCEVKNRFAMAPLSLLGMSDSEGGWSQRVANIMFAIFGCF